jgi:hypothetical protein
MGSRIKHLLEEVEFTYLKMKTLYQEIGEANRNGKRGKAQQLVHTSRYLYKKLLAFKVKFNNILKGSVCNIQYEYEDLNNSGEDHITSSALLVNVTDEEIEDILKLYCKFHGYQFIRILEIQRIPTKFG